MTMTILFETPTHRNLLLEDFGHGQAIQANQHLIIHNGQAILLDPGGHKVFNQALSELSSLLPGGQGLQYLFFSHADPDIVAAVNRWLITTDAIAYASKLWQRFIPHFGLDDAFMHRLLPIPDEGMFLDLGGSELMLLPAHFLHSVGNFQVYDPVSKILYSGDLGSSIGMDYTEVQDFDAHLAYMESFHRRYMASSRALRAWARMVRPLDLEIIAPQHGAFFRGRVMIDRFLDWCAGFQCGIEVLEQIYEIPK